MEGNPTWTHRGLPATNDDTEGNSRHFYLLDLHENPAIQRPGLSLFKGSDLGWARMDRGHSRRNEARNKHAGGKLMERSVGQEEEGECET